MRVNLLTLSQSSIVDICELLCLVCCQVFSMDMPELSAIYYANARTPSDSDGLEHCAEQLATLCATLGEYPLIRYQWV